MPDCKECEQLKAKIQEYELIRERDMMHLQAGAQEMAHRFKAQHQKLDQVSKLLALAQDTLKDTLK